MAEAVQDLVPIDVYQQTRSHVFPSIQSVRWYVRNHREALIQADALVMLNRRYLVVPGAFDAYAMRAARETARQAAP